MVSTYIVIYVTVLKVYISLLKFKKRDCSLLKDVLSITLKVSLAIVVSIKIKTKDKLL